MIRSSTSFPVLAAYAGSLSAGVLQLLEQKGTRWQQRADSEILERGRDDLLLETVNREPANVEGRLKLLADVWLGAEENSRGFPSFSAVQPGTEGIARLQPTRLPLVARHLVRESLQNGYPSPAPLHLVASGDSPDDFVEGLMVYLCLLPLGCARPQLNMEMLPPEREAHREARRRPPERNAWAPYRIAPPASIEEDRVQAWRWLVLDPPFNKRWVNLPPHKILKIDEDRRAVEILIAERGQPEYEIVWYPSGDDWKAMAGRSFWNRELDWKQHEFYARFDAAYRVHETLRPVEIALESALRTLQVGIGRRNEESPVGDLARALREDLYDFLYKHGSGGGFLDDLGKDLQLMKSAQALVDDWLPRIRNVLGGRP
ncbi:MAG TPA: hypothetical protein VFX30_07335 [bacterium]|nr:hypothetical protein [bacterium]